MTQVKENSLTVMTLHKTFLLLKFEVTRVLSVIICALVSLTLCGVRLKIIFSKHSVKIKPLFHIKYSCLGTSVFFFLEQIRCS